MEKDSSQDFYIVLVILFAILLIYFNSCNYSHFGSGPSIFLEEGYGEKGSYYDNIRLEPIYREIRLSTVYDE